MDTELLSREDLRHIIHDALSPNEDVQIELTKHVKKIVTKIWTHLAINLLRDTEMWHYYSKAAIIGLRCLLGDNEVFHEVVERLSTISDENRQLNIPEIPEIESAIIYDTRMFRMSIYYGYTHTLCMFKHSNSKHAEERLPVLFRNLYSNCVHQTRYTSTCIQLLTEFIKKFDNFLRKEDFDYVLDLVYFDLDKKEILSLLVEIMSKCNRTSPKNMCDVLNKLSRVYKHKYILIAEFLSFYPTYVDRIEHNPLIYDLMYAMSKPNLCAAAAKLYQLILSLLPDGIWIEVYYPSFKEAIICVEKPTLRQKNAYKYLLEVGFITYPGLFHYILDDLHSTDPTPVYTILSMVCSGTKGDFFQGDYDFAKYIEMGIDHREDYIRNLSFSLLCKTSELSDEDTYEQMKKFISLNINDMDNTNRDMAQNSYECFLKGLQIFICKDYATYLNEGMFIPSVQFFNWLVPFLLKQFTQYANYQRITLAFNLLRLTFKYLLVHSVSKEIFEPLIQYTSLVEAFNNVYENLDKFHNILRYTNKSDKDEVIDMILRCIPLKEEHVSYLKGILEGSKNDINSSNIEVSEMAQKMLQLSTTYLIMWDDSNYVTEMKSLQEMIYSQWEKIQRSRNENIFSNNNALHSLIMCVTDLLQPSESDIDQELQMFLKGVIDTLLQIFQLRIHIPYSGEDCVGVAKAFTDQGSQYHACTVSCMWLILKASCKLIRKITMLRRTDEAVRFSLDVFFAIIQKCNHKGALEFAGDSLSEIVSAATENNFSVPLIEWYLLHILRNLPGARTGNTVVRRAAETRVFIASIAVYDRRRDKPLYHRTMNELVRILKDCVDNMDTESNFDVHSLILHCLYPLISNTIVENHIVEYITHLTIFCLKSFESDNWNVRNAALQAFSALSVKLLGPEISSNEDKQCRSICIEEVCFKYPVVFNYLIEGMEQSLKNLHTRLNIAVPIFSLLGMTYTKDDGLIPLPVKEKVMGLSVLIKKYINGQPHFNDSMLASNAFTALCYSRNLLAEVEAVLAKIRSMEPDNQSGFYAMLFLTKSLCEKFSMLREYPQNVVEYYMKCILAHAKKTKSAANVMMSELVLQFVGRSMKVPALVRSLKIIHQNAGVLNVVPGISVWVDESITYVMRHETIPKVACFVIYCVNEDVQDTLKITCFRIVRERVQEKETDRQFCERNLVDILVKYLYKDEDVYTERCLRECVKLILALDAKHLRADYVARLFSDTKILRDGILPNYFMGVFCSVLQTHCSHEQALRPFFRYCGTECLKNIESTNMDELLLKSVLYVSKFATSTHDYYLMVVCLYCSYKMIQTGNADLTSEARKIIAFCFNTKEEATYASVVSLINREILVEKLDPFFALELLAMIYTDCKSESTPVINVFDQEPICYLETNVIRDEVFDTIQFISEHMDPDDRARFVFWFHKYYTKNNEYEEKLRRFFKI